MILQILGLSGMKMDWEERKEHLNKFWLILKRDSKKTEKNIKKLFTYYNTRNIQGENNYRSGKEWGLKILYHDNGNVKYKNLAYKKNGDDNSYLIFTGYDKYERLIEGNETWWDGFEIKSGAYSKGMHVVL